MKNNEKLKSMKKIWIHQTNSFKEAAEFDTDYYCSMKGAERLEIVQFLREQYFKIKGQHDNARRKRLRRSIKIIQ